MLWEPMDAAPKDTRIMLKYSNPILSGVYVVFGKWNNEEFANKPNPYWTNDLERLVGKVRTRGSAPVGWVPVPE